MNNPLSRLIAQAEVGIAERGRRAVDEAAAVIKAKSQDIVSEAVNTASSAARVFAIKAALAAFAGAMLIVALAFGSATLFYYLERITDRIEALAIMAGLYAILAIGGGVALILVPSGGAKRTSAQAPVQAPPVAVTKPIVTEAARPVTPQPTVTEADQALRSGLDAVVSALGDAGFQREQAGLRAGLALASQLRPMQLVSLALLGGFVAGVRLTRRRDKGRAGKVE